MTQPTTGQPLTADMLRDIEHMADGAILLHDNGTWEARSMIRRADETLEEYADAEAHIVVTADTMWDGHDLDGLTDDERYETLAAALDSQRDETVTEIAERVEETRSAKPATLTARYADADDPAYHDPDTDWQGGWVLEDARGEWLADLTPAGRDLVSVRDALEAAGFTPTGLTPVGGNITGPTNPVEWVTESDQWTFQG